MTDLIDQLRKTKTSAEVATLIPKFEQARVETQRKLDLLENSREDAILAGSAERQKIRDEVELAKNTLDDMDAALRVAGRRHKKFADVESDEKLKADSKQWHIDAKKEFELRDKAFKHLFEAFGALSAYREIRQKATWRTVIGRADALGLKPVDEFSQLLASKGNQRPHPVNDEALFARLKEVNGFKDHLQDLGIEV